MDTALARDLGLDRPYVTGPRAGRCPGSAGYGHGLTATAVHGDRCCEAQDRARAERIADRSPEAE